METTLIILAAGKNSRANYQNKALFTYKGVSCLENTIRKGLELFDHILLVGTEFSKGEYEEIAAKYEKVETVSIVSGFGTLDALLKVVPFVKTERMLMCWGDLWFKDDYAFKCTLNANIDSPCIVPISYIKDPYSWYIMDDDFSIKTTQWRRSTPNPLSEGYFDQSCYLMNKEIIVKQLSQYNEDCLANGIESKLDVGYEVLYENGNPAKAVVVDYGHVFHFNTQDEFSNLAKFIGDE